MKLSRAQNKFVKSKAFRIMVIAGPGSGKTRALVEKIKEFKGKSLAITFTKKAAGEIRTRLENDKCEVETFHSLALKLINERETGIISETLRKKVLKEIKQKLKLKDSIHELSEKISNARIGNGDYDKSAVRAYENKLEELGLLDYDDLLIRALKVSENKITNYGLIIVDEFQDTNQIQYQIIKKISRNCQLCVIGDPNQAIYGFRGAMPFIFSEFKNDFTEAQEIFFNKNFRSSIKIIKFCDQILKSYMQTPARKDFGKVELLESITGYTEADYVIRMIEEKTGGTDLLRASELHSAAMTKFSEIAVIYRTHEMGRIVEQKIKQVGYPYKKAGEESFLLNEEVINIISLLKKSKENNIKKIILEKAGELGIKINEPVKELIEVGERFSLIRDFLKYLEVIAEENYYEALTDRISLLTMHASKGLEFDYVIIVGVEDGLIPFYNNRYQTAIEEEKRLFYVACSRAREELYLSFTKKRKGKRVQLSRFIKSVNSNFYESIYDERGNKKLERVRIKKLKKAQIGLFK